MTRVVAAACVALLAVGSARGDATADADDGWVVWPESISPDGKLGVLVPGPKQYKASEHQNKLVEIKSGRVIAVLASETVHRHQNHADPVPRWSPDGATLVWRVDGKWGTQAFVVLRVDGNKLRWQTDVRALAVARVLRDVREAEPTAAAAVKKQGQGNGGWFRDGLAIDVGEAPVKDSNRSLLPMAIRIQLTSDPKDLDRPGDVRLDGELAGMLAADGTASFDKLHLRVRPRS